LYFINVAVWDEEIHLLAEVSWGSTKGRQCRSWFVYTKLLVLKLYKNQERGWRQWVVGWCCAQF